MKVVFVRRGRGPDLHFLATFCWVGLKIVDGGLKRQVGEERPLGGRWDIQETKSCQRVSKLTEQGCRISILLSTRDAG